MNVIFYCNIYILLSDLVADDPEDPVLSTAGSGPAGLAGGVPSVAGSGPGGFNLSQIIQDAFGLAGLPTPPGKALRKPRTS